MRESFCVVDVRAPLSSLLTSRSRRASSSVTMALSERTSSSSNCDSNEAWGAVGWVCTAREKWKEGACQGACEGVRRQRSEQSYLLLQASEELHFLGNGHVLHGVVEACAVPRVGWGAFSVVWCRQGAAHCWKSNLPAIPPGRHNTHSSLHVPLPKRLVHVPHVPVVVMVRVGEWVGPVAPCAWYMKGKGGRGMGLVPRRNHRQAQDPHHPTSTPTAMARPTHRSHTSTTQATFASNSFLAPARTPRCACY